MRATDVNPKRTLRLPAAAFAAVVSMTHGAEATYVCAVMKSPDGFVALRDAPSTGGRLIVRAKEGQAVVIQQNDNGDQIANGPWLRVFHFPGDVIPAKTDPQYKAGRLGWMHKRFVGDCG